LCERKLARYARNRLSAHHWGRNLSGTVLVAEDDDLLRAFVLAGLKRDALVAVGVSNGEEALQLALARDFDLLVLDRNLPGLDGLSVLKALRLRGVATPAMFLTALGETGDRVQGLDSGADDYMAKPFAIEEFLARARALLRRPKQSLPRTLSFGPLALDLVSHEATIDGRALELTAQDIMLLAVFLKAPARVFDREALLDQIGGEDVTPAAVEHAISRLRKKLNAAGAGDVIKTVRGAGYRLNA
jgi:two-component system OmpR family response regulator